MSSFAARKLAIKTEQVKTSNQQITSNISKTVTPLRALNLVCQMYSGYYGLLDGERKLRYTFEQSNMMNNVLKIMKQKPKMSNHADRADYEINCQKNQIEHLLDMVFPNCDTIIIRNTKNTSEEQNNNDDDNNDDDDNDNDNDNNGTNNQKSDQDCSSCWFNNYGDLFNNISNKNRRNLLPYVNTRNYASLDSSSQVITLSREQKGQELSVDDVLFCSRALYENGESMIKSFEVLKDDEGILELRAHYLQASDKPRKPGVSIRVTRKEW